MERANKIEHVSEVIKRLGISFGLVGASVPSLAATLRQAAAYQDQRFEASKWAALNERMAVADRRRQNENTVARRLAELDTTDGGNRRRALAFGARLAHFTGDEADAIKVWPRHPAAIAKDPARGIFRYF